MPSDDTFIRTDPPEKNNGGDPTFEVRPDNGADRRGLVRFDLSTIPANADITNATLYLYEKRDNLDQTHHLYRVTTEWQEYTANWLTWNTPGGDFDNSISYANFVPHQTECLLTINITNLVQLWVNGTYPNYGFMIYATGANQVISYSSKENTSSSEWPRLDIEYSTPTNTSTTTPTPTPTPTPALNAASTPLSTPFYQQPPTATKTLRFKSTPTVVTTELFFPTPVSTIIFIQTPHPTETRVIKIIPKPTITTRVLPGITPVGTRIILPRPTSPVSRTPTPTPTITEIPICTPTPSPTPTFTPTPTPTLTMTLTPFTTP